MFVIEDDIHAELMPGKYKSRAAAYTELQRLAVIPWDSPPNQAPCRSWQTCGRLYVIVEYDDTVSPWRHLSRDYTLEISANGVEWLATETDSSG